MKMMNKILVVVVMLSFSIFLFTTGLSCDNSTDIRVEKMLDDIGSYATDMTVIGVKTGKLDSPAAVPVTGELLKAGDSCFILTLELKNNTDNDTLALIRAEGYNDDGVKKSWTLSPGPIEGLANYDLPAGTATRVTVLMNWYKDVSVIKVHAQIVHQLIDSQNVIDVN